MNKVFISGKIMEAPTLRMEGGKAAHLSLMLRVSHRTRAGEIRAENYRINAWNRAAEWGVANLKRGQAVSLQGYLTRHGTEDGAAEVTAEEFLRMHAPGTEPEGAKGDGEAAEAAG